MRTIRIWIGALLVAAVVPAANAGVMDDMAGFERVYIPALALTNQPQAPAEKVSAAMKRLSDAWPRFKPLLLAGGPPMAGAVSVAEKAVVDAQAKLQAGKRADAHEALESLRPAFIAARRQVGIDLYVDRLVEFHDVMEEAVKMAETGREPAALKPSLDKASALWTAAEPMKFEPKMFGLDAARVEQIRGMVAKERQILQAVLAAVAANDREKTLAAARQLKGNFSQVYVSFGDFSGL